MPKETLSLTLIDKDKKDKFKNDIEKTIKDNIKDEYDSLRFQINSYEDKMKLKKIYKILQALNSAIIDLENY